jgi:hypothetical protein
MIFRRRSACLLALAGSCSTYATLQGEEAEKDRITDLPGLTHEQSGMFDQFSGFVSIADEGAQSRRDIFYWFIESETVESRDTDPVVLWTNGKL